MYVIFLQSFINDIIHNTKDDYGEPLTINEINMSTSVYSCMHTCMMLKERKKERKKEKKKEERKKERKKELMSEYDCFRLFETYTHVALSFQMNE